MIYFKYLLLTTYLLIYIDIEKKLKYYITIPLCTNLLNLEKNKYILLKLVEVYII